MAKIWLHGTEVDPDDPNLSREQRAQLIAQEANECCNRSDGYEKGIAALALKHLQAAWQEGWDQRGDGDSGDDS